MCFQESDSGILFEKVSVSLPNLLWAKTVFQIKRFLKVHTGWFELRLFIWQGFCWITTGPITCWIITGAKTCRIIMAITCWMYLNYWLNITAISLYFSLPSNLTVILRWYYVLISYVDGVSPDRVLWGKSWRLSGSTCKQYWYIQINNTTDYLTLRNCYKAHKIKRMKYMHKTINIALYLSDFPQVAKYTSIHLRHMCYLAVQ